MGIILLAKPPAVLLFLMASHLHLPTTSLFHNNKSYLNFFVSSVNFFFHLFYFFFSSRLCDRCQWGHVRVPLLSGQIFTCISHLNAPYIMDGHHRNCGMWRG
jgi:hypothetical protein